GGKIEPIDLELPILDFSDTPVIRGTITLQINVVDNLDWNGRPLSDVNKRLRLFPMQEWLEKTAAIQPEYNLEQYTRTNSKVYHLLKDHYLEYYRKMFPVTRTTEAMVLNAPSDNGNNLTDYDQTTASPLFFKYSSKESEVRLENEKVQGPTIGQRLKPAIPRISRAHAPITTINGDLPVPMHFYYKRPVDPGFISKYLHQRYVVAINRSVCGHYNTNPSEVARRINEHLDRRPVSPYCSVEFVACLRIFDDVITHLNTAFRYRSDFVVGKGTVDQDGDFLVRLREDTSTDLDMGLSWEDCDGLVRSLFTLIYIIQSGVQGVENPHLKNDRLFSLMFGSNGGSSSQRKFGGWTDDCLNAFQRLLFYYTPLSLLGLVINKFPGEDAQGGVARVNISDMGNLQNEKKEEVKKLYYAPGEFDDFIAHAWSIALPFTKVLDSVVQCIEMEDREGTERLPTDQSV